MKIGILLSSISRRAGGLFWSVRALARAGQQCGDEMNVFSVKDQFSEQDQVHWAGLELNLYDRVGPASFGFAPGLKAGLESAGLELLHTHGIWMYPSLAALQWARRTGIPYLISPRGMLDPWAVKNAAWKKRIAATLYENAHLKKAACIHALCDSEAQAIRGYGLKNPVCVVPNGVDLPLTPCRTSPIWGTTLPAGASVLLYLGRIHPKKGLRELLMAWNKAIRNQVIGEEWYLVVAGWDQGGFEEELKTLAADLGIDDRVRFVGPQFDEAKQQTFERAQAFILPSFSEGLPMVVLEAMAHGLPVLMTTYCNLPEVFKANAALRMDTEVESIVDCLGVLASMTEQERINMGKCGLQLVQEHFTWDRIAQEMQIVHSWVLGGGDPPNSVEL